MDHNTVYGVDVSKRNLVTAGYDAQTPVVVHNRPESIAAWLAGLPRGAAVAMEATGAYHQVLAHLAHAAGLRVYVLNPQTLKHYAWAIGQRGKTDQCDARMIARYAVHEQAKLRCWVPPGTGSRLPRAIAGAPAHRGGRTSNSGPESGNADAQSATREFVGEL
jgi:transposase